jgi:hypothetical protein
MQPQPARSSVSQSSDNPKGCCVKAPASLVQLLAAAVALLPGVLVADVVDTAWVRRYAQPGYCNDEAVALCLDRAGNVYVTGSSQRTEAGYKDIATVKYSPAGVQQWAARFAGPQNSVPSALAVDDAGNVYLAGASESTGTSWDYLTVKYNSAGVEQWHDRYNGPGSGDDRATGICVDGSGNVAVCGYVAGVTSSNDWTLIGYTAAGGRRFVTPRSSAGGNPDEANAIVCDPAGDLYVAGRLWYQGNVDDAVVAKYTSAGAEDWTVSYDGPLSGDGAVAICRSTAGDLYATGWSTGTGDNADVLVMKVTAAGALAWTARYAAPENGSDMGTRIAVDAQGNPRVLGRVQVGPGGDYDLVTLGYSAAGAEQFANRLGSSMCTPGGLALTVAGSPVICGSLGSDYLTLAYNGTSEAWRRVENWGSGDAATALALDDSGYVYVTGRGDFGANAWDFVTIKYNPNAGVAERSITPDAKHLAPAATVVRGMLRLLPRDMTEMRPGNSDRVPRPVLLDATGRRVMDLAPDANDVSRLAPGVYFVRVAGREQQAGAAKVVIQH